MRRNQPVNFFKMSAEVLLGVVLNLKTNLGDNYREFLTHELM